MRLMGGIDTPLIVGGSVTLVLTVLPHIISMMSYGDAPVLILCASRFPGIGVKGRPILWDKKNKKVKFYNAA
jgi:hypothetical protein